MLIKNIKREHLSIRYSVIVSQFFVSLRSPSLLTQSHFKGHLESAKDQRHVDNGLTMTLYGSISCPLKKLDRKSSDTFEL